MMDIDMVESTSKRYEPKRWRVTPVLFSQVVFSVNTTLFPGTIGS